jgi:hypothetical protein
MSTTLYLNNAAEIAAANRAIKDAGYPSTVRELRANDRYVMNIVSRLAGGAVSEQRALEAAVVAAVSSVRNAS